MKASVQFLGSGKGFNVKEVEKYGHGFLIASHVSRQLDYILYASHKYPGHTELMEYFLSHYNEYTILGGGSIVRNNGILLMHPITSSVGYIPMSVSRTILPFLQTKIESLGIPGKIKVESHENKIKEVIKKLSKNWGKHTDNF